MLPCLRPPRGPAGRQRGRPGTLATLSAFRSDLASPSGAVQSAAWFCHRGFAVRPERCGAARGALTRSSAAAKSRGDHAERQADDFPTDVWAIGHAAARFAIFAIVARLQPVASSIVLHEEPDACICPMPALRAVFSGRPL